MSKTVKADIDDSLMASVVSWLRGLQDTICAGLSKVDGGASFNEDVWERDTGGGGRKNPLQFAHQVLRALLGGEVSAGGTTWRALLGNLEKCRSFIR